MYKVSRFIVPLSQLLDLLHVVGQPLYQTLCTLSTSTTLQLLKVGMS